MKKTSVLVNTGRGTVVDSDALANALHEGWIWGAGLDVVSGEPNVPADHPLVKEPRYLIHVQFFFLRALFLILYNVKVRHFTPYWEWDVRNSCGYGDACYKKCVGGDFWGNYACFS